MSFENFRRLLIAELTNDYNIFQDLQFYILGDIRTQEINILETSMMPLPTLWNLQDHLVNFMSPRRIPVVNVFAIKRTQEK